MVHRFYLFVGLVLVAAPVRAQDEAKALAAKAKAVLKNNCFRCHGKDGEAEDGFDYVLDVKKMADERKLVAGDPGKSRIYVRAVAEPKPMPPKGEQPRPSKDDLDLLKRWIESGAPPFPPDETPNAKARTPLTERDLFAAVEADLRAVHPEHARFQRYFSFAPQYNDPRVGDADLRLYRAGLSKLLNSLSWKRTIVLPRVLGSGALLALDLRDLDWDVRGLWQTILRTYPYGLKHDRYPESPELKSLALSVYRQTGTELPLIRADWLMANASQPPLYETLLGLPNTAGELEKLLKVDVRANFRRDKLARAGFAKSNVSGANRLIERHEAAYGAYWISYDFKSEEGPGQLTRFPLGPLNLFPQGRHPYPEQAFVHDGGEIIFHLPNGLQGYLLVDGAGQTIPDGPAEVVRDKDETAGRNTIIVNGLSCMACHNRGMKRDFLETVRDGAGVGGDALDKVRRLYPPPDRLKRLLDADEELFLASLDRAIGPFVKVGADAAKPAGDFPEPVSYLVKPYLKQQLTLDDGARELGVAPAVLQGAIQANDALKEIGLRPWVAGGTVSRRNWESTKELDSPYQRAAALLKRGDPVHEK